MKRIIYLMAAAMLAGFAACKKPITVPPTAPVIDMEYIDLHNLVVKATMPAVVLDLNNDDRYDVVFGTQLVGDPVYKVDKTQFMITGGYFTSFPVNANEEVPVMPQNTVVPISDFNGYNWYNASGIMLMQRTESLSGQITWQGNWLNKFNQYLPIQLVKNNQRYNGWIALTADQANQRLILHRAALGKQPEKNVIAGK